MNTSNEKIDEYIRSYYGSIIEKDNLFYIITRLFKDNENVYITLMSLSGRKDKEINLEITIVSIKTDCNCHYDNWVEKYCSFDEEYYNDTEPKEDCEYCLGKGVFLENSFTLPEGYIHKTYSIKEFIKNNIDNFFI